MQYEKWYFNKSFIETIEAAQQRTEAGTKTGSDVAIGFCLNCVILLAYDALRGDTCYLISSRKRRFVHSMRNPGAHGTENSQ